MKKIINLIADILTYFKWPILIGLGVLIIPTILCFVVGNGLPFAVLGIVAVIAAIVLFVLKKPNIGYFVSYYKYPIIIAGSIIGGISLIAILIAIFGIINTLIILVIIAIILGIGFVAYNYGLIDGIKKLFSNPKARWICSTVAVAVLAIFVIVWIYNLINNPRDNEEETTTTVAKTTTEEETTTEPTTTVEKPTVEESTVEEPTVEEPTSTEKVYYEEETTTSKNKPSETVNRETAEVETTRKNQDEIASSKKEELNIPEGASDQIASSVKTTTSIPSSNEKVDEKQTTTKHVSSGVIEKTTEEATTQNSTHKIIEVETPEDFYGAEKETTTVAQTTTTVEKPTTEKVTTTTEEVTTQVTKVDASITISYTKGASVANVLVTLSEPVDGIVFRVWWYTKETDDFIVLKNSDTSYSIKVTVPENYKGKLLVGAYESDGTQLLRTQKIINNQ